MEGDRATIRVHPGIRSLKGALASRRGKACVSPKFARQRQKPRVSVKAPDEEPRAYRLIDTNTNLIVRYLVQDHEKACQSSGRAFDACDRDELTIVVLPAVPAQCVFVLESFYERPRAGIAFALARLISSPGIEISEARMHVDALIRYRQSSAHFVDCLIAATAVAEDTPVATFDQDFRKFADVAVETE